MTYEQKLQYERRLADQRAAIRREKAKARAEYYASLRRDIEERRFLKQCGVEL